MKNAENIEKLLKESRWTTRKELDEIILADATAVLAKSNKPAQSAPGAGFWRMLMQKHRLQFASAAAILVVALIAGIYFLNSSTPIAYAIEQTIQASHSVRWLHIKDTRTAEFWVQFDDRGDLHRCRMDFPNTEDGPKVVVWQENMAQVWFKAKKSLLKINDQTVAEKWQKEILQMDPKAMLEKLLKMKSEGNGQVEIKEPTADGGFITIIWVTPAQGDAPARKQVFSVDPANKLVTAMEKYQQQEKEFVFQGRLDFLEYNQPIDAKIFELDVPNDVRIVDQITEEIGLAQGNLSNDEIARELVRQFITALLIDKDYDKAGRLLGGVSGADLKAKLGKGRDLDVKVRIASIGQPVPHTTTKGLQVPVQLEFEYQGEKQVGEKKPIVRQVHGQPERWEVIGGF